MLKQTFRFSPFLVALFALTLAGTAEAQKKKKTEAPAEEVKLDEEETADKKGKEDDAASGDEKSGEEAPSEESEGKEKDSSSDASSSADSGVDDDKSPVEKPGQTYYFVGARLRGLLIPTFIIEAFGEGGKTVIAPNFGPEFIIRRDGFEWNLAMTYTSYVMSHTPFKAPDDPVEAIELVDASLKVLYLQGEALWSKDFSPQVGLQYGFGFGLGVVWGPLARVQAYPVGSGWEYCPGPAGPGSSPIQLQYCQPDTDLGSDPQHWPGYEEPSWTSGGSKPILFPWLSLNIGLRFKPTKHFAGRIDAGIGFGQVFFGLGADYGL
jgi:hypothetical protein